MSAIASAATATVLAFGVAYALDNLPAREPTMSQVQRHGSPGAAKVELAEKHGTPPRRVPALSAAPACAAAKPAPELKRISPATRALRAWPAMYDVLRPVTRPDPPRATDLAKLSVGPAEPCSR